MTSLFGKNRSKQNKHDRRRTSIAPTTTTMASLDNILKGDDDNDINTNSSTKKRKHYFNNDSGDGGDEEDDIINLRSTTHNATANNGDDTTGIKNRKSKKIINQQQHAFTFDDLGLNSSLLRACRALGYNRPTPVQRAVIPLLLHRNNNKDSGNKKQSNSNTNILALSPTGSGKTAAYILPILHLLTFDPYGIACIILSPTRELASQIRETILALGRTTLNAQCTLIVGGGCRTEQCCELERDVPHFISATPGRMGSLLRMGGGDDNNNNQRGDIMAPYLGNVKWVVLDEADRLLAPGSGFARDVAEVMLHATTMIDNNNGKRIRRKNCRVLMFSATLTRSLRSIEVAAGSGSGVSGGDGDRLPLTKIVVGDQDDDDYNMKNQEEEEEKEEEKKKRRMNKLLRKKERRLIKQEEKEKQRTLKEDDDEKDKEEGKKNEMTDEKNNKEEDKHSSSLSSSSDSDSDSDSDGSTSSTSSAEELNKVPKLPSGLRQEYVFMPSRVRDAYLVATIRALLIDGGLASGSDNNNGGGRGDKRGRGSNSYDRNKKGATTTAGEDALTTQQEQHPWANKCRSAIIFVQTCEKCALLSSLLTHLGVSNVAIHSLLEGNRRLSSLHLFREYANTNATLYNTDEYGCGNGSKYNKAPPRVLVATDVAGRGLDLPGVDLVLQYELPRRTVDYVHRCGRAARAGRRGLAVSLVSERDVGLVQAIERLTTISLVKCTVVKDDNAVKMLKMVSEGMRLAKMSLDDIGFLDLVKRMKERKVRDRKDRTRRAERATRGLMVQGISGK